jgi:hypothetical protein
MISDDVVRAVQDQERQRDLQDNQSVVRMRCYCRSPMIHDPMGKFMLPMLHVVA